MEDTNQLNDKPDLESLTIKQLKQMANDISIDISNCIEKKEIVDKLKNLLYHQYEESDQQKISINDFECIICLDLLCEPITISCGHTFCRVCISKSITQSQKLCPVCREPCHIDPKKANETLILSKLLKQNFPQRYTSKLYDTIKQKQNWEKEVPIFFYNKILFPTELLALHLFELRYRNMIKRVVESNKLFMYVPNFSNYQAKEQDLGILMHVDQCEFLHDGRAMIKCTGKSRALVKSHWIEAGSQGLAYCSYLDLKDTENEEQKKELSAKLQTCKKYLKDLQKSINLNEFWEEIGTEPSILNYELWSLWLCSIVCQFRQNDDWSLKLSKMINTLERFNELEEVLKLFVDKYKGDQQKKENQDQIPQNQNDQDHIQEDSSDEQSQQSSNINHEMEQD